MSDNVNHPSHYTAGDIECIDAIQEAIKGLEGHEAYITGNVLKYMWRWKRKNGAEDLKKARFYLDRLIKQIDHGHTDTQILNKEIRQETPDRDSGVCSTDCG